MEDLYDDEYDDTYDDIEAGDALVGASAGDVAESSEAAALDVVRCRTESTRAPPRGTLLTSGLGLWGTVSWMRSTCR